MPVQAGGGLGNVGGTTYLTGAVALNNISNFFDVVSTPTLPPGTYQISCSGSFRDTAAAGVFVVQLTDGTNVYASSGFATSGAGNEVIWGASVVVTLAAAGVIKMQARETTATTGQAMNTTTVTGGVANKATYITYVRLY